MYIRWMLPSPTSRYSKKRLTNGCSSKPNPINKPQILSVYSSPVSSLCVIVHSNLSPFDMPVSSVNFLFTASQYSVFNLSSSSSFLFNDTLYAHNQFFYFFNIRIHIFLRFDNVLGLFILLWLSLWCKFFDYTLLEIAKVLREVAYIVKFEA